MRSLCHITTLSHSLMAPSTKTLTEPKLLDPGESSPGHTITVHLKERQWLPGEYSPVMLTLDSGGHHRPGEMKISPQNWRLRTMMDTSKTKQVRVNLEPFQTLDQEIIQVREPVGGPSPSHSTNMTMHQSHIFLKSNNYSSRNSRESSGSESSKHSKVRASPASDSSSKRWSASQLHTQQLEIVWESSANEAVHTVEGLLRVDQEKRRKEDPSSETMKEDNDIVVLLTPAELIHQKAVLMCKQARLRSPNTNQWLYKMARETVISSFSGIGIPEPNKNDEGFDEAFMGIMAKLIKRQPASWTGTPPLVPSREYKRNVNHQMTFVDIQMPATLGIEIIIPQWVNILKRQNRKIFILLKHSKN